jgi:hypothetical protein
MREAKVRPNKFERRHYIEVAKVLHDTKPADPRSAMHMLWNRVCLKFSETFKAENPRFSASRFLEACNEGIKPAEPKEPVLQAAE